MRRVTNFKLELESLSELNPRGQSCTTMNPFLMAVYRNQKALTKDCERSTLVDLLKRCIPLLSQCVSLFPSYSEYWSRDTAQKSLSGLQYLVDEFGEEVEKLGRLMETWPIKWLKKYIEETKEESRFTRKHYEWVPDHSWWTFREDSDSEDCYYYDEDDEECYLRQIVMESRQKKKKGTKSRV